MSCSDWVLARRSPLGAVWIAADLERKQDVNTTQIDSVNTPSYTVCIVSPELPIALRLSGHLLLGLVRIYSWKVNHPCGRGTSDQNQITLCGEEYVTVSLDEDASDDPMDEDPSPPFIGKVTPPPEMYSSLYPVICRGSLFGASIPNAPRGHGPTEDEEPAGGTGISVLAFTLEPSPPRVVQDNKRKRRQNVQEKNKTRPVLDDEETLSLAYMAKQMDGDELGKLVRRKKIAPLTALDLWRFNRMSQKDSFFSEPLVQGTCTDLHKACSGGYPRVSDSDADSADVAKNVCDEDAPTGNADTQEPEPHLTSMSPENVYSYASLVKNTLESDFPFGTADLDEDLPEFPGLMNTPSMISSAGTGSIMSTRTRAAAQYFKGMMSSATSEDQPGKIQFKQNLGGEDKEASCEHVL
ncbi:uncharacterized protein [Aegilops tauschii subsp. strangulata]|uniref:uncharacterized protein n=1 Tax=Aegilops tauschii subsp. strangulata TaxID=200361 RepID=UPI003CC84872